MPHKRIVHIELDEDDAEELKLGQEITVQVSGTVESLEGKRESMDEDMPDWPASMGVEVSSVKIKRESQISQLVREDEGE